MTHVIFCRQAAVQHQAVENLHRLLQLSPNRSYRYYFQFFHLFQDRWTICNQYPILGEINPKTKTMKIRSLVFSTLSFTRFCTFPFMCLYFVSYSAALPFLLIFLHGISGFGQCSNVFLWMTTIQCIVNDKATLKHP